MTPKKIHILSRDLEILDADTPITRAWVSLNPHESRTEYTDLSQVWHDVSNIPSFDKGIVGLMDNGGIIVIGRLRIRSLSRMRDENKIRNWTMYTRFHEIVKWAYVDDLLPKGGKQ